MDYEMLRSGVALGAAVALVACLPAAPAKQPRLRGNNFFSNCKFSHTAPDDPIVHPGRPGRSHPHTFFGNTSTDAYSTPASLRRAATTCKPSADTAAYWVPTLFQDGREVRPMKAQLYYVLRGYDQMRAFPAGLKMIAGNADATRPQSTRITYWACGGQAVRSAPSTTVPETCPVLAGNVFALLRGNKRPTKIRVRSKTLLELHVNFPDCWDGRRLDSADHRSHMAHSREYVCPASHPVKVPLIRLQIRYPLRSGAGVSLASGGQFSGHADFVNAWDQRRLEQLVEECFRDRPCDRVR
jgi:hypothetical protein